MATKRFAQTTDEEIETKRMKTNADNTLRANRRAANTLRDYLREHDEESNFEEFDESRLSQVLQHFYMDARKPDGDYYKSTSLINFRHSLNRYLQSPPFNKKVNVVTDSAFLEANKNFKAALTELKRLGKGAIDHHPIMREADRQKLYTSMPMNPSTPSGLYNKVQFDVRFYFCRRGSENIHSMTKSTFKVTSHPGTGMKYVLKVEDELTKNHRETDTETDSGIMPELRNSPHCPVRSFETYIGKLHPDCDKLWQRPKDTFCDGDEVWYCNAPVGEKKLSSFLTNMSRKCELSQIYTNHSIRATGATVLSKSSFGAAQIMSVTGHKSVQSLTTYQRVDTDEKLKMGEKLAESLVPGFSVPTCPVALPCTAQAALPLNTSPDLQIATNTASNTLGGINLNDLLCDFGDLTPSVQTNITTSRQSFPQNLFPGCTVNIGTLNVNIGTIQE